MSKELEIAAAAALAGHPEGKAGASQAPGLCHNCQAPLQGPWCHACGQKADDHHRSILRLLWEMVEGMTHLDGRLANTLPPLVLKPGRLAADYLSGRQARHIPPFRLFLVSLLIFTLSAEHAVHKQTHAAPPAAAQGLMAGATPAKRAAAIANVVASPDTDASPAAIAKDIDVSIGKAGDASPQARWLRDHLTRAIGNPDLYLMVVFQWADRLAILLLPILAAQLTVFYIYRRRFYVYDHLLVAMQYLSFCFLLWGLVLILPPPAAALAFIPALVWTPGNLFLTLRGAYGSSWVGAGLKSLTLWISTLVAFLLLILGLLGLALGQV